MQEADLQVATEGHACRVPSGPRRAPEVPQQVLPARLHAAAAVRLPCRQGTAAQELPRRRSAVARLGALVPRDRDEEGAGPQHAVPRVSRAEPGPTLRQAAGPGDSVVRAIAKQLGGVVAL